MGFRASSLRTKVVALLVTLTALWAFGAWVTLRDGLNLLWLRTLENEVYAPTESLVLNLQAERRLSLGYLGAPDRPSRGPLEVERRKAQADAANFRADAQGWWAEVAARPELEARIAETLTALDGLNVIRAAIDGRRIGRVAAARAFTDTIETVYRMYGSLGNLDGGDIDRRVENLIRFDRSRELASQADALLTGAFAAGSLSPGEYTRVIQLIGARRMVADEAMAQLPEADQDRYRQATQQGSTARLSAVEDRIVQNRPSADRPAVSADDWRGTVEPALQELQDIALTGRDEALRAATPVTIGVIVRVLIAAFLGLLAVVISVTTARSMVRQLNWLRQAALRLANERLPELVGRLGRGEPVNVNADAPPLRVGPDEIGQVAQAFNIAQETAIRTAVEQAELRRGVRDIFLSLARRTQGLLHRQLSLLDAMERRETDPEELEELFRVDHLATRMRRNAENLIVLSGATPGRAWRRNVPMVDVLRGAVAEVEDYARVSVLPIGQVDLAGRAVGDVIHLLAELIENALSFSPPHTGVQVSGQLIPNGYVVEIEDRGLGMSPEDRAAANERIATRHELTLTGAAQLGLYVVSRLIERHGIRVRLKESPYGGTTAVVLIPPNLVSDRGTADEPPDQPTAGRTAEPLPARRLPEIAAAGGGTGQGAGGGLEEGADGRPGQSVGGGPGRRAGRAGPGRLPARVPGQGLSPDQDAAAPPEAAPGYRSTPGARPPTGTGEPTGEPGEVTPSGLPLRVRQANLAPALRTADDRAEPDPAAEQVSRSPEQVRRMMSSYQSGTRRGRSEAARLADEGSPAPATPTDA